MSWKSSRYNHAVTLDNGGGLLYNGRTGAILELSDHAYNSAQNLLATFSSETNSGDQPVHEDLFPHLAGGGFLVDRALDELAAIEQQYQDERKRSQFLLTILPTFGCNLGCDYCFVGKKNGIMQQEVQEHLVAFVDKHLMEHSVPSMNVDWFGGEPLLAMRVIEFLSRQFIRSCEAHQLHYRAQVITNGTVLTAEVAAALQEARVDRLQITLDGPGQIHDERRPYKAGKKSSFDTILEGLHYVIGKFLVRLRVNVDARNLHQVWDLLELFAQNGWIGPATRFFPYLARLSPFTDACSGVSDVVCTMEDFYRVQFRWMEKLEELGVSVAEQGLYQFPEPKLYNCGAVGANGFVFTPEGEIHKCGLTVDDSREAVGHLTRDASVNSLKLKKWNDYSPLTNPVCRSCEFLPTCLGGCPRNQMESRVVQMKENCTYHMKYEKQIMLFHLGHRAGIDIGSEYDRPAKHDPLFRIL